MFFAALRTYYPALSMVNSQLCHNAAFSKLIPKSIRSTDKTLLNFTSYPTIDKSPFPKTQPAFTKMKIVHCLVIFKAVNFKTDIFAVLGFYAA